MDTTRRHPRTLNEAFGPYGWPWRAPRALALAVLQDLDQRQAEQREREVTERKRKAEWARKNRATAKAARRPW